MPKNNNLFLVERFGIPATDLKRTGVYSITHCIRPGRFYVGSTGIVRKATVWSQGFYLRWRLHLHELTTGNHANQKLQNLVNKHGDGGLVFGILEYVDPDNQLLTEREQFWMLKLNSVHPEGYNLLPYARSSLGKTVALNGPGSKRVTQFNLNGKRIASFPSSHEAFRSTGTDWRKVSACCCGNARTAGGFVWRFSADDFNRFPLPIIDVSKKPVVQMRDGQTIASWPTISMAARTLGLSVGNISECLNGRRKSTGGFQWAHAN